MNAHGSDLNDRSREAWDANASHWDERMGEGNRFNLELSRPAIQELLEPQAGWRVLDAGCGNGQISRWLARFGATVLGFDFSAPLIELARRRSAAAGDGVEYRVLDATGEAALLSLGEGRFDAVVSSMALMDMPAIEPLIRASRRLLKPDGRFVFSVTHPCFNTSYTSMAVERFEGDDGTPHTDFAVRVRRYKSASASKGVAMSGQPAAQYYFNRPLEALLGAFFTNGFVMDGAAEPAFAGPVQGDTATWSNFTEIPPVFVARMRPLP